MNMRTFIFLLSFLFMNKSNGQTNVYRGDKTTICLEERLILEQNKRFFMLLGKQKASAERLIEGKLTDEKQQIQQAVITLRKEYEERIASTEEIKKIMLRLQNDKMKLEIKLKEAEETKEKYMEVRQENADFEAKIASYEKKLNFTSSEKEKLKSKYEALHKEFVNVQALLEEEEINRITLASRTEFLEEQITILGIVQNKTEIHEQVFEFSLREVYKIIDKMQQGYTENIRRIQDKLKFSLNIKIEEIKTTEKTSSMKYRKEQQTIYSEKIEETYESAYKEVVILQEENNRLRESKMEIEKKFRVLEQKFIRREEEIEELVVEHDTLKSKCSGVSIKIDLNVGNMSCDIGLHDQIEFYGSCLDTMENRGKIGTGNEQAEIMELWQRIRRWEPTMEMPVDDENKPQTTISPLGITNFDDIGTYDEDDPASFMERLGDK